MFGAGNIPGELIVATGATDLGWWWFLTDSEGFLGQAWLLALKFWKAA